MMVSSNCKICEVTLKKDKIIRFKEKPQIKSSWINGDLCFQ